MSPETTSPDTQEIDRSATLPGKQVVHRMLEGDSGQDYYVYVPENAGRDAPLFVAVHDISRNAEEQMKAFSEVAEKYGAVVVAPHFDADRYPNYQRLGRSRHSLARGKRADGTLDAILEEVAALTGASAAKIHLFGYAAGARFALRYAMAHPDRVAGAVIASAGTYTFPDAEKRFPQGIAPGPGRPDLRFDPDRFLRVPLTVVEGSQDGAPGTPRRLEGVGRSPRSGSPRNGRGFALAMKAVAEELQLESLVSYREVEAPVQSFKAYAERGALAERVFETLFGPLPGQDAATVGDPWGDAELEEGALADAAAADAPAPETAWDQLRRRALPLVIGAAVIALLAPLILWGHYRSTHVVSREAMVRGHIAEVGARLSGVVRSVEVDTGDHVEAGQIVARLEDRHFVALVMQARSQLEKATRELEVERLAIDNERLRLVSGLNQVSAGLSVATAGVEASDSRVEEASRRLELQRTLAAQGLVAEERVRTAETELRTAQAVASASRAERRAASAAKDSAGVNSDGLAVREKRISVLESDISAYAAELAVAEANLEGAIIRAPDNGAVVRRIAEPGVSATVGQPIISLWVGEEVWVEAWIDEDDLADVGVGSEATVTLKPYPDREFRGVVESIGVSTDFELPDSEVPQPRNERMRGAPIIGVRIRLDESEEDLFPGLSAIVGIRKKDR